MSSWLRRGRDEDLEHEMQFHLDGLAEELIAKGVPPDQARLEARRQFGNITQTKERYRDQLRITVLDDLVFDVRQAFRHLTRNRWMTAVVIVTIALAISLNNMVFTIVDTVMLRDLPFENADRVMALGTHDSREPLIPGPESFRGLSYPEFRDWLESSRALSALAAYNTSTMNLSEEGLAPARFEGAYVSANTFDLIGRQPIVGRTFRSEDDQKGAAPTVILGEPVWTSRYGGDRSVIGRTVRVNAIDATIIGVMPAGFGFPISDEVWQPLAMMPGLFEETRRMNALNVVGRLADGVTMNQARDELSGIASRLAAVYPDTNTNREPVIAPYAKRHIAPQVESMFLAMMSAVAFVLLIACANVANLLLGRAARRSREIAIRVSLGATRWRIIRQLLLESVLLAMLAGVVGLVLSFAGLRLFDSTLNAIPGKPYWLQFTMNGQVLAFLACACLGAALLFGFAPALHLAKTNPNNALKEGGRGSTGGRQLHRLSGVLVIGELVLTLMLLAGAGFMMRTFIDLYRAHAAIDVSPLTIMRLDLPGEKYPTAVQRAVLYQRLDDRLATIPSIASATLASHTPLGGGTFRRLIIDGRPPVAGAKASRVQTVFIGRRYFETLGLPVVRGRAFADADGRSGQETAIVNEQFVATYFSNEDPMGRRIRLTNPDITEAVARAPWLTIVGVAKTVDPDSPTPMIYLPYRLELRPEITLIVRDASEIGRIAAQLREEVRALDPDLPLFAIQTMNEWRAFLRWPQRVFGTMFSVFACIALLMSAVGLHAVTAQSVTQRTQEIGIRMALGAEAGQVWWMVLRQSLVQLGIGLALGLAGAFGVGRLLQGLWVNTSPRDPVTLTAITALLVFVSLAACYWPARCASRLDPIVTLRYE